MGRRGQEGWGGGIEAGGEGRGLPGKGSTGLDSGLPKDERGSWWVSLLPYAPTPFLLQDNWHLDPALTLSTTIHSTPSPTSFLPYLGVLSQPHSGSPQQQIPFLTLISLGRPEV